MSKSDNIQHKYREVLIDPILVHSFSENEQLYDYIKEPDELLDLIDELNLRIKNIIEYKLTTRQRQVVEGLYFRNLTQMELAHELGLCQPSIHKSLLGNISYGESKKRYGGAIKKMQKICDEDPEIQGIINKIDKMKKELQEKAEN